MREPQPDCKECEGGGLIYASKEGNKPWPVIPCPSCSKTDKCEEPGHEDCDPPFHKISGHATSKTIYPTPAEDEEPFDKVADGEWVQPEMTGYKMKCCNCALVHVLDFEIFNDDEGHYLKFRAKRLSTPPAEEGMEEWCPVCEDYHVAKGIMALREKVLRVMHHSPTKDYANDMLDLIHSELAAQEKRHAEVVAECRGQLLAKDYMGCMEEICTQKTCPSCVLSEALKRFDSQLEKMKGGKEW